MKRKLTNFLVLLLCTTFLLLPMVQAADLDEFSHEELTELALSTTPILSQEDKDALLSALYEADISQIRKAIDLKLISCQELTAYYMERIETYNEEYNCFITICDNAMEQAAQRDAEMQAGTADGLLFGIPIVVKDNIHVAGYPTTNGYSKSSVGISKENAAVVDRLLEEGAIIIAKSNMSTEAQDARASRSIAVGETKNAYNTTLASGGSSGGSAVSTSLNFCAAALGTDTNSSLRIPAALNGCVSLRVTTGLLPMDNIIKLNSKRDVVGALTRSVEDQAIMLDVLSGNSTYYDALNANALNGLRIGILEELSYARSSGERSEKNIDDEVYTAFEKAIREFEARGAEMIPVSMPKLFSLSDVTFPTGGYKYIDDFTTAFEKFLVENDISAVVFPTYLSTPLRSGTDENGINWKVSEQVFINNCRTLSPSAAVPEITVPIGTHSLGAGIGMEIATSQHNEQLLLDIAYSYTMYYNHREAPSGAPDMYTDANNGTLPERINAYLLSLLPKGMVIEETVIDEETTDEGPTEEHEPTLTLGNIIVIVCTALVLIMVSVRWTRRKSKRVRKTPVHVK